MFLQIFRKTTAKIVGKGKTNGACETQRYRLPQCALPQGNRQNAVCATATR